MLKSVVVAMSVVLTLASAGYGLSFDDVQVEYWTGEGANSAMMIVDFGQDAANFAFGYKWNGEACSYDMIGAIADAGLLDAAFTYHPVYLHGLDSLSYSGYTMYTDWVEKYCFVGAWASTDGESWQPHATGICGRLLSDGDWDGYTLEDATISEWPLNLPVVPQHVPEPTTVSLLLISAAGLFLKRRSH
ncbi:MAG: PEP-CTERM sorting domain-containing protein [Planctomycetes bacterium]|nr:PEP-CTERM sorting domain-containing protein [Planctomycetota bacterium]